jgi:hypothetical protein
MNNSGVVKGAGETTVNCPDVKVAILSIIETKVGWHGEIGATNSVFRAFAIRRDSRSYLLGSKDIGDGPS